MRREEFLGLFLGFIVKKTPYWLPEEGLEEDMLEIMQERISQHSKTIKKVLERNAE